MADSSDGQELVVENDLGMVLEEDAVTLINAPCLDSPSIILTDSHDDGINVSHYIIPHEVTVAGFEEVVEEDVGSSWDSITSASPVTSLGQDSGIESDANPDVFFAFVDDTVSSMTFLTSVPCNDKGEIFVQKMYEIKEDMVLPQVDMKDEDIIEKDLSVNKLKTTTHVVKFVIKEDSEKDTNIYESEENVVIKHEDIFNEEFFHDFRKNNEIGDELPSGISMDKKIKSLTNNNKNSQKQLMYHCTECNINFMSHRSFKGHMEEHLIRLQNSCALCNREFSTKSELQEHIKDHFAKSSTVNCEICKKEFVSRAVLKRHKKQSHSLNGITATQSIKCEVCHAVFSSKFSLKSHSVSHNTRKPFTCKECGATFTQNGSLQVHLRRHRGEKPFKCSICGNNFTRAHSLKVHMKTHTGEKPYSCEYCGACFVTSSHLTVHKRTHTGERPYSCNSCGATFITTSHLNVHRRLHNSNNHKSIPNYRTISCSICGANFDDPGKLRYHRRTDHKGMPKSICSVKSKSKDKRIGNQSKIRTIISTNVGG